MLHYAYGSDHWQQIFYSLCRKNFRRSPPPPHLVQWQDKMVLNLPKIFLFSCTVCCMLMRCAPTAVWGFHVRFLFRSTLIIIIIQCKQSFRALREAISETVSGAKWNPTKKDVGSGFFTYFELDTNNQI